MNHIKPYLSWFCLFIQLLNWTCILSCTTEYTAPNGALSSTNFSNQAYCSSTIKVQHNKRIRIKWQSFDFPGKMPGCGDGKGYMRLTRCSPEKYLIRYCGDILPPDFISYENCIRIDYFSDYPGAESFQLHYETLDTSKAVNPSFSDFTIDKKQNSLNIYTPNWPLTYSGKVPAGGIRHRVMFNNDMDMKIIFMGIDLYAPQQSSMLCEEARNDVLELEIVLTSGEKYSLKYCGQQQPFTKYYSNSYRYIDFIFNPGNTASHNHKGFALGISFFERTNDMNYVIIEEKSMNTHLIVAIIIPIVCVFLFLGFMRGKLRQRGGVRDWFHTTRQERRVDHVIPPPRSVGEPPAYTLPVSGPPLYPPPAYAISADKSPRSRVIEKPYTTTSSSVPSQQTTVTENMAPSYPPPPPYEGAGYSQPGQVTSIYNIGT